MTNALGYAIGLEARGYIAEAAELRRLYAENERLRRFELANNLWHEKTDWVQETVRPLELGRHRADVLRQRIERLHAVNAELLEALRNMVEMFKDVPTLEQNSFDEPPEPKTQWDYEAYQKWDYEAYQKWDYEAYQMIGDARAAIAKAEGV